MNIVIVYNPGAGRGRGESVAADLEHILTQAGHKVRRRAVGPVAPLTPALPRAVSLSFDAPKPPPAPKPAPDRPITDAELIIVVGGDGTLHHILGEVPARRIPIYHAPLGTENLFAREFGTSANPRAVAAAVAAWRLRDIDLGVADGRRFAVMCSIGADASVIRRLALARTGAISHRAYIRPVLSEILKPCVPSFTITVDGQEVVSSRRGMVIVANSRQYARRMDPAHRADLADGALDVVFLPGKTSMGLLARLVLSRLRLRSPGAVWVRGRRIEITADHAAACAQLDGETGPVAIAGKLNLAIEVEPLSLRVLLAPDAS